MKDLKILKEAEEKNLIEDLERNERSIGMVPRINEIGLKDRDGPSYKWYIDWKIGMVPRISEVLGSSLVYI